VNRLPTILHRHLGHAVVAALLGVSGVGAAAQQAASAPAAAASAPTLRAEVAKPLAAAQELLKAGNAKEALVRIGEAEAISGPTPYEAYMTHRLKGPAALGAGDAPLALKSFETVLASPLLPPTDRPLLLEYAVKLSIQTKDYARASKWLKVYLAEGGSDATLVSVYPQVLRAAGDHAGAVRELNARIKADEAAGRSPTEATLRELAANLNDLGDAAAYVATVEKLAASTGKTDYWVELVSRTVRREGFADDRLRLDVYRLKMAVGIPGKEDELLDMAQRALLAGLPGEAQKLLDDGYAKGLLGSGANAQASQKLREQATKAAAQDRATVADSEASARNAKDGNALFGLGFAMSGAGANDKALTLMTQGQAKGGLRRPDDAQLHLGVAYWRAGRGDDAKQAMAAVKGSDGTADLARLWTVYLGSPARK
jgi:hypothetical protein